MTSLNSPPKRCVFFFFYFSFFCVVIETLASLFLFLNREQSKGTKDKGPANIKKGSQKSIRDALAKGVSFF